MSIHPEALAPIQARVLRQLGLLMSEAGFYLAGGTAVALQLGHRRSVDFDWFTRERLTDPMGFAQRLRDGGVVFTTSQVERGTLHGTVRGVRVSCLEFRYPLLAETIPSPDYACHLASLDDLASMKLSAIAQRGARKDFVDIHALCRSYRPLSELLTLYQTKFGVCDLGHLLYSLVYFDDAERERMPQMIERITWTAIKRDLRSWVASLAES